MFKNYVFLLTVIQLVFLTGCSTLINGTSEKVVVATGAVQGAKCSLENDKGRWSVNQTPESIVVHKSCQDLLVKCEKVGYKKSDKKIKSTMQAAMFGNVFLGGIIGVGVDTANGAGFSYPKNIDILME